MAKAVKELAVGAADPCCMNSQVNSNPALKSAAVRLFMMVPLYE
jgi:hypothetical protein